MSLPDSFRGFVAQQQDGDVERRVDQLCSDDLPPAEVTVRVGWSSINYKDALATIPDGQVARISPLVPGVDLAGEVVASDHDGVAVGSTAVATGYDLGVAHAGGWAEYARIPAEWIVPLPEDLTPRQAMVLGTAGLTAGLSIHALEARGLRPDQGPVLVLGATGGVGSIAVGALATAGYEVHAVTAKEAEHDYLRSIGAEEILTREETGDGDDRPLAKQRWAACIDPVGGSSTAYALKSLRYGGAVALSGLTAGTALRTTVMPFILRGVGLLGIDSVNASAEQRRQVWERLATDLRPRGLDESIAREVDLDGIEPVLQALLDGKAVGRTVVRLSG